MSNDSTKKKIVVALGVCLVCSILVSTAAVSLHGIQEENKKTDKVKNILIAGNLFEDSVDVTKIFDEKIQAEILNLKTGEFLPKDEYGDNLDPEKFDIKAMAKDPQYGTSIPGDADIAQIHRMPLYVPVYKVYEKDRITKYILPIYGKGLWSTLYGFIALDKDLVTIKGITFYEHGETPGLGGEVDNPRWKQTWVGKKAFDGQWNVRIEVIKGKVDPSNKNAIYQIDGLSGSTLTTRGVDHLVRFWLGQNGYAPFFSKLREEGSIYSAH